MLPVTVPAPASILRGIRKLAPATTLTLDAQGNERQRVYWRLTAQRPAQPHTEAEWTEAVHDALRLAVRRRLDIADVPVGVLLSGGLDSSLLVALLAETGVRDLRTFSVGFEDQPEEKGSEFEYSDPVAARYQTRHHKYLIPNDQVLQRLPEAVTCMAEPMVGQDAVAFFLLAEREAARGRLTELQQTHTALMAEHTALLEARQEAPEKQAREPGPRAESTYLNIIGALLSLLLGKSPGGAPYSSFRNMDSVISALLAHHEHLPGISERTLWSKLAQARRHLQGMG